MQNLSTRDFGDVSIPKNMEDDARKHLLVKTVLERNNAKLFLSLFAAAAGAFAAIIAPTLVIRCIASFVCGLNLGNYPLLISNRLKFKKSELYSEYKKLLPEYSKIVKGAKKILIK